jgi:ribosomal protein L7/L12
MTMVGGGVGPSGLAAGFGAGKTSGTSMTDLARRAAPPDKAEMTKNDTTSSLAVIGTLIVAFVVAFFVYEVLGFLWATVAFVIVFVLGVVIGSNISQVDERFRKAYAEWDRKYMCMTCGATKLQPIEAYRDAAKQSSADPELDRLIRAGQKIQAVAHVRARSSVGLAEALKVVERRTEQLS